MGRDACQTSIRSQPLLVNPPPSNFPSKLSCQTALAKPFAASTKIQHPENQRTESAGILVRTLQLPKYYSNEGRLFKESAEFAL